MLKAATSCSLLLSLCQPNLRAEKPLKNKGSAYSSSHRWVKANLSLMMAESSYKLHCGLVLKEVLVVLKEHRKILGSCGFLCGDVAGTSVPRPISWQAVLPRPSHEGSLRC